MDQRTAALLDGIGSNNKILELGASVSPMAPRSAGWDVTVVDHASQEDLIKKYRLDPNVNVANIEKVDFVWQHGPLHEAVPSTLHGTFDVLIASHVIEHIPDPIGFMISAARLLHPERGILALAIPDKRWCFDCLKQVSTTGQMLAAHKMRSQRHTSATRFDFVAYTAFDKGRAGWGREPLTDLKLCHALDQAFDTFQSGTDDPSAPYEDFRAWQFTPASFELLILETGAVGLMNWRISWLSPRPGVEFLARLVPGKEYFVSPADRDQRRLVLLRQILLDLREQTDWLVQSGSTLSLDTDAREQLQEIAETAAMVRAALRPGRALWRRMLPVRRKVARLRGRT